MTARIVHRPARITEPAEAGEPLTLAAPPQMNDQAAGFPIQSLLPIVGSLSSITMMVLLRNNPIMVVVGAVILVVALVGGLGMAFTTRATQARQRRTQRERYLDYLERTRSELRVRTDTRRTEALLHHPAPGSLIAVGADVARRWERRPSDDDFLHARLGSGEVRAVEVTLPAEQNPVQPFDPIMKDAAEQLERLGGVAQGMPVAVDLSRSGHISIVGPREDTLPAARALIAQLATFHAPEELELSAVVPFAHREDWRGFDLLPHVAAPATEATGIARRIAPSLQDLFAVIGQDLRARVNATAAARRANQRLTLSRSIIVIDEGDRHATPFPSLDAALTLADLGITIVHLVDHRLKEPSEVTVRITASAGEAVVEYPDSDVATVEHVRIDAVGAGMLETIARPLAGLRLAPLGTVTAASGGPQAVAMTELLGLTDIDAITPQAMWTPRSRADFLRVPVGVDDAGVPLLIDIKESAQSGMGPHGICIGATGSGKSELLRTLIMELALTHSPEDLSMILVDFKGGAAFSPFARLPHIAGIIDNLADDPQLTQRARASINGEVVRRQRVLKDAGNLASIGQYRELRKERADLPPLPHLFLVIDEFGELLTAEPDFVDLLLTIGRIGRSIGVHLLLSSQRIEAGKLRGLDTYLSYRIGLRTFSEAESSVVLDTPDAFHLPAVPGYGYLKVDTSVYTRFRAGYVSGPLPDGPTDVTADEDLADRVLARELSAYDVADVDAADEATPAVLPPEPDEPTTGPAVVDAVVDRIRPGVQPTRPVWLPPLPTVLTLGTALTGADMNDRTLSASLGLIDDPSTQRQDPWRLDLTRSGGHISIMGAPQSGKSTFLRTLTASLSYTHTPREVSIYGMDLTGGGLSRLEHFPHVGGVATRGHRERLLRLMEELNGMLLQREAVFREHGLDSLADLRRQHAEGRIPELPSADVLLLVDGFGSIRTDFEDLDQPMSQLLERGGSFGMHVIMTMARWNEIRMAQQSLVGTRLELKLNDPGDSQIARKLSATLRTDEPGRILTDDELFAQLALPVFDESDDTDIGEALERLGREATRRWGGPAAAPIRLLPDDLDPAILPDALDVHDVIPLGIRQDTMEPAVLDFAGADPHMLVLGDTRCGKTTLLRGIIQGALDRYSSEEIVIALMDSRGDLVTEVPEDYLGGHAAGGKQARQLSEAIAAELDKRQTTRESGPRVIVIADDFDILSAGGTEPLRPLLPYLASARDLRLNVILTRPVSGASRAMYDVAMQTVRDTGGATFIMSGERSEGQLLPKLYAEPMVAGRGRLARRGERPMLVQVANFRAAAPSPTPVQKG